MIAKKYTSLWKPVMVCFLLLFLSSSKAQKNADLSISEIHALIETMVNYSPDSSLALLDLAAKKIELVKDKEEASAYWAENNLRRADYWLFEDLEKAKLYCENAYYYYSNHVDNKKLGEIFGLKAQIKKQEGESRLEAIKEAIPIFDTALSYALKTSNPDLLAFLYYEKAFALQQTERWQESFENAFLAIQHAELSGDSLAMATAYFLMGRTHHHFGLFNSSELYIAKSIEYGEGMFRIYSIVHIYADILLENDKIDLALENYEYLLDICLQKQDTIKAIEIYTNIGQTKFRTGDVKGAEQAYFAMNKLVKSAKFKGSKTLLFMARMHLYWGDKKQAKADLDQFREIYNSGKISSRNIEIYKEAADLYAALGHMDESAIFYKKWGSLKDSLYTHTSRLQLSDLEKMYLNERNKNQEIVQKNEELSASRSQQAVMAGVLILVLLIGVGMVYFIRMRGLRENQALKFALKEKQMEQLMDAQESERQRLARELHDGIGQSLAALKMQLQFDDNPHASSVTVERVDALCEEVRSLSHQMMPLVLKENGLKAATKQLLDNSFANSDTETDLVTHGLEVRLPDNVEVHLYRITQELITNIIKHANATEVGVQLLQRDGMIVLIVEDNGKGFNEEEEFEGIGIKNMYSRIEALAGTIKIQSSEAEGTYVRIAVPIGPQQKRKTA